MTVNIFKKSDIKTCYVLGKLSQKRVYVFKRHVVIVEVALRCGVDGSEKLLNYTVRVQVNS